MISQELKADILRKYHAEKWKVGTIARQLGIHHSTVQRVLTQEGLIAPTYSGRKSKADPYLPFMLATLAKYPLLTASRLYAMVRERGYSGQPDHFRSIVARLRPRKPAEAFLRLRTLPAEQAQVDWAHFGKLRVGRALRPLMAFLMVLSFSRMVFLRFYLNARMPNFLRGHVDAFAFFGGVPRVALYDNLKSAVLERYGDAIRFHPTLLELAGHYRYEPRPVARYRGNQKGRVERAVRYARDSFFAARSFADLADLNAQALRWCEGIAADRRWPDDHTRTVREAFDEERPLLLPMPETPFEAQERAEASVRKTPYVRFDLNDYSVPHTRTQRTLSVVADLESVRIYDGLELVGAHARSFDKGQQVEDPAHVEALRAHKRKARAESALDLLQRAVPSVAQLVVRAAERGANLGSLTARLRRLLDAYHADALERAVAEALARGTPHLGAIRQILDQERQRQGLPPPIAAALPDDPRVRDLCVRPHSIRDYDQLMEDSDDDNP
jgi:transposase